MLHDIVRSLLLVTISIILSFQNLSLRMKLNAYSSFSTHTQRVDCKSAKIDFRGGLLSISVPVPKLTLLSMQHSFLGMELLIYIAKISDDRTE